MPQEAEVLASYDHYKLKEYAAITKNHYEKGTAIYIGCMTDDNTLKAVIRSNPKSAEVEPEHRWPVIVRKGTNDLGKMCQIYPKTIPQRRTESFLLWQNGKELLSERICTGWRKHHGFTMECKNC